jgi:hypothetical protein
MYKSSGIETMKLFILLGCSIKVLLQGIHREALDSACQAQRSRLILYLTVFKILNTLDVQNHFRSEKYFIIKTKVHFLLWNYITHLPLSSCWQLFSDI